MDNDIQHLPFNKVNTVEINNLYCNIECFDINELNGKDDYDDINDKFDHTFFSKIYPDINILDTMECLYYNESSFNEVFKHTDNLSFIHINICSIPKNFQYFDLFLNNLKHKFPIICCSESWFKASSKDRYTPKHFSHVYDFRPKKRGGGTSIFIKNGIEYESRDDLKLDLHTNLANSCFIEINKQCINSPRNVVVGCIYKTPHLSITEFNDKFNDLLNIVSRENKDIYLLGDYNINIGDGCQNNLHVQEFNNMLSSHCFTPLIRKHTRINSHSATIIDNILTNVSTEQILCSGIFPTRAVSDHFPIFCMLRNVPLNNNKKTYMKRNFSQKNISKFKKHFKHDQWTEIYSATDPNEAFNRFQNIMNEVFMIYFPEEKFQLTYENRYLWLTKSLKHLIKEKHKLSTESTLDPMTMTMK